MGHSIFFWIIFFSLSSAQVLENPDPFTNFFILTSEDIENLPVTDLNDLLMLVPGVNKDYKTLHFRGSAGMDEIAYYLDGIPIKSPEQINLAMIDKIIIQKSGFTAEYGDGLSGIVFIQTKKTARKLVNLNYLTDDLFPTERLNYGFNQYNFHNQASITKNIEYSFAGRYMFTDAYSSGLYKVSSPGNCYNGLMSLDYRFANDGSIMISGYTFRNQFILWNPNMVGGNGYKYFEQSPMNREKGQSIILSSEYPLSNKTIVSIRFIMTNFDSVFGNRDYEWEKENGNNWYDDYRLKGEHLISYLRKDSLTPRSIVVDSLIQYHNEAERNSSAALRHNPYGVPGLFYINGDYPAWSYSRIITNQFLLQLKQTITENNELKFGIDYKWQNSKYYNNPLPWYSNVFWNYFELKPYTLSGYLEDRWLTNRIGIYAGIRYSYIDYGLPQPYIFPLEPHEDTIMVLKKNFFSPRLGINLPVSRTLNIFFNGGEYYYESGDYMERFEPEKIRSLEIGFRLNPHQDFSLGLSLYQKYLYDYIIQRVEDYYGNFGLPYYSYLYTRIDRTDVSGIELNFEKSIFAILSSGISYNLQFANQLPVYEYGYYYEYYYYPGNDPITGEPINAEKKIYPLDYDCRHSLKTYLTLKIEEFILPLLNNTTFSLFFSFNAGLPYTPADFKGIPLGETNSSRMPGFNNLDFKYQRYFNIGSVKLTFTCLIENLLNSKQIIYVYSTTGKPDDHGDPEPASSQFGWISITSAYYSPQADLDHNGLITPLEMKDEYVRARSDYYSNPLHYNNSFRLRLGIGLKI